MKILVAGAGGFIGGHLVRWLETAGHTVIGVDVKPTKQWFQHGAHSFCADLKDYGKCLWATSGCEIVYNLAADMGGMGFIERHKADCMLSVLINTHLLKAAHKNRVDRFFFSSSACVYAADKQKEFEVAPLKESDAYPAMPEDGYGWEKLFSERMCRHFREDFRLETRVARYHNVYGPFGTYQGGREKAPAAICRKVIEAKLNGSKTIEIWGSGHQTRSFMYIDDCIQGTVAIAQGNFVDPINLGSAETVTINQLVDIVEEIAGTKLDRVYDHTAPLGVNGRSSDNTLIKEVFNWEPPTKLRDGMEKTYAWIYDQMTA